MTAILSALAAVATFLKGLFSFLSSKLQRKHDAELRDSGRREQELKSIKGTQRATVKAVQARRDAANRPNDDGLPYDADAED